MVEQQIIYNNSNTWKNKPMNNTQKPFRIKRENLMDSRTTLPLLLKKESSSVPTTRQRRVHRKIEQDGRRLGIPSY
jgi:hypothetical protein